MREAHAGRQPSQQERSELVSLLQELAELMLQAAKQAEAPPAPPKGKGKGAPTPAAADPERAAALREEATQLLLTSAQLDGGDAAEAAPLSEEGARMAVKLGHACVELGQWEQAEVRRAAPRTRPCRRPAPAAQPCRLARCRRPSSARCRGSRTRTA